MRVNRKIVVPAILTHEGAKAVRIDAEQQLRRSVLSCMLWESEFYVDGQSIADRITSEVKAILQKKGGAKIVADLALEARSSFKLRHAPLHLIRALVQAAPGLPKYETVPVIADALAEVIQRPDELSEFLSMYWATGKKPIPNQVKKGLGRAFQKFNEYSLGKYANRDAAVKLRDVLFLTHVKPKDDAQAEVFKKLANGDLKAPENSWEVKLSSGTDKKETFTKLFSEGTGSLATLRNLRNAIQSGVDDSVIRNAILGINIERVLPFRFITAARYASKFEPELEQTMLKCIDGHEKLKGKTVLVVDNSGSMYGASISAKSELTRADAAQALAILLREICEEVQVVVYSGKSAVIAPRRGFALRDLIQTATDHGSTDIDLALQVAAHEGYDRVVVITDEQSQTAIGGPLPGTKGYFINVASNQNGIGYNNGWNHFDGMSEAFADYILAVEKT